MDLFKELTSALSTEVLRDEPMSRHTTFRVGGPARYYVMPSNDREIEACLRIAGEAGLDYFVIGNGSNLLVSDAGYDGLVIAVGKNMSATSVQEDGLRAQAGISLAALSQIAKNHSLTGLEFASGIPGTLGGAIMMNAGAYGGEMKDVLESVITLAPDGTMNCYEVEELQLGYRHSILMERQEIVLKATLCLQEGNSSDIAGRMEELAERRISKQPLEYPSAGSTFKRPEGHFAGALIEQAGLKGCGIGDACVSEKHAGFIINKGNASARDIYETICMVQERVRAESGVDLVPEVRFLGHF